MPAFSINMPNDVYAALMNAATSVVVPEPSEKPFTKSEAIRYADKHGLAAANKESKRRGELWREYRAEVERIAKNGASRSKLITEACRIAYMQPDKSVKKGK